MTVMATRQALTPRDLRAWPTEVQTALLAIVNNRGVRHRIIDGSHLLLYPPSREARPVKFSAKRPAEANIHFLEEFCAKHLGPYVPEPRDDRAATVTELSALRALNSPEHQISESEQRIEWRPYLNAKGETTTFETNGKIYRCTKCQWITETGRLGPHASHHKLTEKSIADRVMIPRLEDLRKSAHLSAVELGRAVGVTGQAVRIWERKGFAPKGQIPKIAAALDVRVSDLTATEVSDEIEHMSDSATEATVAIVEPEVTPQPSEDIIEKAGKRAPDLVETEPTEATTERTETESMRAALLAIADLALGALGHENIARELRDAKRALGELEATMSLMREALGLVDS